MHFKLLHFIFNINYYYLNFIKIYYADVPTGWQHFPHRRRDELFCVCLAWLNRLASGSGWLRKRARLVRWSSQVPLNYGVFIASSAQVPASLQLYYSSTSTSRHHVFHVSVPPCLLDRLVGWLHLMYCTQMYCLRRSRLRIYCRRVLTDRTID